MKSNKFTSIVLLVCGMVCIIASFFKATVVCHGCPFDCVFDSCFFTIFVAVAEILFGSMIISYHDKVICKRMAVGIFSVFLAISLYHLAIGESCNCFGNAPISPIYIFALDCSVLAALILISPDKAIEKKSLWRVLPLALSGFVVFFAIWVSTQPEQPGIGYSENGTVITLRPEAWIGFEMKSVRIPCGCDFHREIQNGRILIVRGNCGKCPAAVENFQNKYPKRDENFILILPPTYPMDANKYAAKTCLCKNNKRMVCKVPVIVHIEDSIVVNVETAEH